MSPIAFEVSDCPAATRRLIWFGGPRLLASLYVAAIPIGFGSAAGVAVQPRWRLVLGFSDACLCIRKLLRGLPWLSSFASPFHTCFRFLFRCFDRSATFRPAAGSQEPVVVFTLVPIGSRSLLFDFAGAADAMSPLGVGRQWTPRRSWGGW